MAEYLDDGEFWLPSQFLTDDDLVMEKKKINYQKEENTEIRNGFCFPSEFPYGFSSYESSVSSSPVESVVSSTETESDEEDYLAGLTQQMVHSTLQEVERNSTTTKNVWVMSGSPQSTLFFNHGSPNGPSQVSSPPIPTMNDKDDAWGLLFAAAGKVVRMKMNDEMTHFHNHGRGLLGPPRNPSPVSAPVKNNPNFGGFSNRSQIQAQALTHHQLQNIQFQKLNQHKQYQEQCSGVWGRSGNPAQPVQQNHQPLRNNLVSSNGFVNGGCVHPPLGLSPSSWPPLQNPKPQQHHHHQAGSGMRAVFLGGPGARKEKSSGTGVFLPRRIGNPSDTRKKTVCSTALLPERVVHALKLNFDDMGSAQKPFNGGYAFDHSGAMMNRNNLLVSQQRAGNQIPIHGRNPEIIQLPQEWTY